MKKLSLVIWFVFCFVFGGWVASMLMGCTQISVDFQNKSATVTRFMSDASLESAKYSAPDGTVVEIGGYDSKAEKVIEILKLVK